MQHTITASFLLHTLENVHPYIQLYKLETKDWSSLFKLVIPVAIQFTVKPVFVWETTDYISWIILNHRLLCTVHNSFNVLHNPYELHTAVVSLLTEGSQKYMTDAQIPQLDI